VNSGSLSSPWRRVHLLVFALLWLGPTFAASLLSAPYWQTNDDPFTDRSLRGFQLPDGPDPYPFHSGTPFTFPLAMLYSLTQEVPWFFLAHLACRLVAAGVLIRLALHSSRTWERVLLLAVNCATLEVGYFIFGQFTETGVLITAAGMLAWIRGPRAMGLSRGWWSALVVTTVCLGGAVRFKSCALTLVMLLPPGVVLLAWPHAMWWLRRLWRRGSSPRLVAESLRTGRSLWTRGAPMAITLGALFVLEVWNAHVYGRTPEYREFLQYAIAQQELFDYGQRPYREDTRAAFESVGWTANDHTLAKCALQLEEDKFNKDVFLKLAKWFDQNVGRILEPIDWPTVVGNAFSGGNALFLCLPLGSLCLLRHRRKQLAAFVVVVAMACVVLAYCGVYLNKLPLRVIRPTAALVVLFMLTAPARRRPFDGPLSIALKVIGVIFPLLAAVAYHDNLWPEQRRYAAVEKEYRRMMAEIAPYGREPGVIFIVGCAMPYEAIPAYDNPYEYASIRTVFLATARFPAWKKQLDAWDTRDVFRSILYRPDTYLLMDPGLVPMIWQALYERFGEAGQAQVLTGPFDTTFGGKVHLVRFVRPEAGQGERTGMPPGR
jgi:hypothetical protein